MVPVHNPPYPNPPRLLLVDDEEDTCTVMKWGLQQRGYDVDAFSDPLFALQNFRPYKYDLVLIDVRMPVMDGLEFYRNIKEIQHDVKVVFMTAASDSNEEFVTKRLPGDKRVCVAIKPIRIEELVLLLTAEIEATSINSSHTQTDSA